MRESDATRRQVLVVDDEEAIRTGVVQALATMGLKAAAAAGGTAALEILARSPYAVVLLDIKMPDLDGMEVLKHIRRDHPESEVIMMTGFPTIQGAVEAIKHGALDYLVKPFRLDDLEAVVQRALDHQQQRTATAAPAEPGNGREGMEFIVGDSPALKKVFAKIRRAAPSDSTVILTGESGTGKELAARAIHLLSSRRDHEFVPVDCSALVETLLESELFGHVKGSFTGAHQSKHGLFELANHGTFFFDEITNLSLNIQAKLLRVIQEREFMQVGSQKRIKLDIRIIASSNRDLTEAIKSGAFREDLFYRLSVIPIHLPPLRERSEDIPLLAEHFLRKYAQKGNREVTGICAFRHEDAVQLRLAGQRPGTGAHPGTHHHPGRWRHHRAGASSQLHIPAHRGVPGVYRGRPYPGGPGKAVHPVRPAPHPGAPPGRRPHPGNQP